MHCILLLLENSEIESHMNKECVCVCVRERESQDMNIAWSRYAIPTTVIWGLVTWSMILYFHHRHQSLYHKILGSVTWIIFFKSAWIRVISMIKVKSNTLNFVHNKWCNTITVVKIKRHKTQVRGQLLVNEWIRKESLIITR